MQFYGKNKQNKLLFGHRRDGVVAQHVPETKIRRDNRKKRRDRRDGVLRRAEGPRELLRQRGVHTRRDGHTERRALRALPLRARRGERDNRRVERANARFYPVPVLRRPENRGDHRQYRQLPDV